MYERYTGRHILRYTLRCPGDVACAGSYQGTGHEEVACLWKENAMVTATIEQLPESTRT